LESHPLRFIRSLGRSREIATVLLTYGFGDLVERLHLGRYLRWGKRLFLRKTPEPEQLLTRAQRIRLALEELGPTFIKFGQVVSTRPDLVPDDIIRELSFLRERVPQFSSDVAVQLVEEQFGARVDQVFDKFEKEPIAAGSLAQVHRARHRDGSELAVKIRRPNVVKDIERDLDLMLELAILIERHIPEAKVFDPIGLVQHFARTIRRELNFMREGRTLDEFSRLFRNDATLVVPEVYLDLTTESVLTMRYIDGHRLDELETLESSGISKKDIAANGAHIFMKQAFELGIFHGDPHPGNIRIMPDGAICLLDYGMVGMLEEDQREQLIDLFLSVNRQDVRLTVELIERFGEPSDAIDKPLLRADVRDFVDNYYGVPLERLKVGRMLTDFVGILANHRIRCPADLILLIRAFVTLEGVGRDLDPEFNMAQQMVPFIERVVHERYNPRRIAHRLMRESRTFLQLAHDVPQHIGRTLEKLSRDDLKVQFEHKGLDHLITEVDRSSNRLVVGLVMSSLMVSSALIIRSGDNGPLLSVSFFVLSSLLGVWLIYGVFRSGRL